MDLDLIDLKVDKTEVAGERGHRASPSEACYTKHRT